MCKITVITDEKFELLQKRIKSDLNVTPDNVQEKTLQLPLLYTKYRKLYFDQRKILININSTVKSTKKQRYQFYKFDYDFRLDTKAEIELYVDGDQEMREILDLRDRQELIVENIKDTLTQINKISYQIRSYVDLEKLRNGVS